MLTSLNKTQNMIVLFSAAVLGVLIFTTIPPQGVDWFEAFSKVSLLHPYEKEYFINPPWTVFPLYPFTLMTFSLGLALNSTLMLFVTVLLISKRGGDSISLLLALTSFPFLSTIANGQIEWIPMLGVIIQSPYALPFLLAKPQSGALIILSRMNKDNLVWYVTSALVTLIASVLVWGNWMVPLVDNIRAINFTWGINLMPWSIPFGVLLIVYVLMYRSANQEILAVIATYCLVPYFAAYSLLIPFALLCAQKSKWLSGAAWCALWLYPFLK